MDNLDQSNNKNVSLSLIAEYGSDSDSEDAETRSSNTGNDSDHIEHSEMVLKNNIINACAHGPLSVRDDEEVTRHMIIDGSESGVVEYEVTEYRDVDSESDSTSSDSSDSEVDSVKDIEEVSSGDELEGSKSTKPELPKVNGELGLDDLPPIEDLAISLPAQETTKIGTIASIVDRLVIVRAFPETPAVDIDSILFLDNGAKALGKVFDVFGPVTEPHYCVRFNSSEHARERAAPGDDVYIAPRTPHTNYVFLAELMKLKGSDASWLHDIEAPPNQVEFSDDEEERRAARARRVQPRGPSEPDTAGETSRPLRKPDRRNQRPSESSSRFGSGRNPFAGWSRRTNPNSMQRFNRPWTHMDPRTPPPHPNDPGGLYSAPPFPTAPPMFAPFPPNMAPFMGNAFQFGGTPRMPFRAPLRPGPPVFGGAYFCGPPPPPGT